MQEWSLSYCDNVYYWPLHMATFHLECALSSSEGAQSRMFDVRFARRAMPKLIPFANPREGNSEYADNKFKMSGMVVWVVTPSSLVDCYQRFAETHCPLLQSSRVTTLVSANETARRHNPDDCNWIEMPFALNRRNDTSRPLAKAASAVPTPGSSWTHRPRATLCYALLQTMLT